MSPSDAWVQVLVDVHAAQPINSPAFGWLAQSRLVKVTELAGVPLYQIQVNDPKGVEWLRNRMGDWFRRALTVAMKSRLEVEIVVAELEPSP